MKRIAYIILFLISFSNHVFSQKAYIPKFSDPLLDKYRWRHYEELSGRNFTCFCEGNDGTMWFGVEDGVMSYDGYKWTEYECPKEPRSYSVRHMAFHGDTLYYFGDGIKTLVNGKWSKKKYRLQSYQAVDDMFTKGTFFIHDLKVAEDFIVGASTFGIYIRKNGQDHFYTNKDVKQRQDTIFKDLKFHVIDNFGSGVNFFCSNILDVGNNTFYTFFGAQVDKRYFKFRITDNNENPLEVIEEYRNTDIFGSGQISSILRPNGEIWVVSMSLNNGLNILRNNEWELFSFKKNLNDSEISKDILMLSDGSILITSMGIIYRFYNNQWSKLTGSEIPFKSMQLNAAFTKSGDLWLGDDKGEVYKIDYNSKHYTNYRNLNYQFTNSDGSLWFISEDEKVVYKKDSSWFYYDVTDGLPNTPRALYLTKNGTVWCAGSHNQVAATAYLNGNKWIKQSHDSLSWSIYHKAVIEGIDGAMWFGGAPNPKGTIGQQGGIVKIQLKNNKTTITPFYKRRPEYYSLAIMNRNTFYAGCNLGLRSFNNGIVKNVYSTNKVDRIIKTETGNFWVATNGEGVLKFEGDEMKSFNTSNGLASNVVFDIYPASDTMVWAATNKGYSFYNGHFWNNDIYPKEFNINNESGKLTGYNKYIWISKFSMKWIRGAFDENNDLNNSEKMFSIMYERDTMPPETNIVFYNKVVDASGNTHIEWDGIDHMHHTPIDKLYYSYRLNDQEWSVPGPSKNINLAGLKSNDYVFEVRAYDKDMNFDQTPAKIFFKVIPPVWKQAWFIILILSFISIVSYLISNIIIRNNKLEVANAEIIERQMEIQAQSDEIEAQNESIMEHNIELEEANATKNKFFSIIAHDIKNPFNAILGFSELLHEKIEDLTDTEKIEIARMIYDSSNNLYQLLENLLHWSRSQRNMIDFYPENIELNSLFHNVITIMKGVADTKNIRISVKLSDVGLVVKADLQMLETIIRNLISNAIKYTNNGGSILISAKIKQDGFVDVKVSDNLFVKVMVADTGVGMRSETKEKLFKIDSNQSTPGTENEKGTGLGLILVKEFVSRHGGEIGVESEVGKGSTFYFTLPLGEKL